MDVLQGQGTAFAVVDDLYDRALSASEDSSLLGWFIAQYIGVYRRNGFVERLHLRQLERTPGLPFDVAFFIAHRRRQLRTAEEQALQPGALTIE